jgi:hypothetical protein
MQTFLEFQARLTAKSKALRLRPGWNFSSVFSTLTTRHEMWLHRKQSQRLLSSLHRLADMPWLRLRWLGLSALGTGRHANVCVSTKTAQEQSTMPSLATLSTSTTSSSSTLYFETSSPASKTPLRSPSWVSSVSWFRCYRPATVRAQ